MSETVAQILAREALAFEYDALPDDVVERTRMLVVDAVACGLAALGSPTALAGQSYASAAGDGPATLLGTRTRVPIPEAIVANHALVRYLDYNDYLIVSRGPGNLVVLHPSGSIPTALAVAEAEGLSGAWLVEAVVAGYHVAWRIMSAIGSAMEFQAMHHGTLHGFVSAAVTAHLKGLSEDQLAAAFGIAGSSASINILDNDGSPYTMLKSFADGLTAERGYRAAVLAEAGVTGPLDVFEGPMGFVEAVLRNRADWSFDPESPDGEPAVMRAGLKLLPAEGTTHGFLIALMEYARSGAVGPDDVAKIVLHCGGRCARHTGDPAKRHPPNKETADHSGPYLAAVALIDGRIDAASFDEQHLADPVVRRVSDLVELVHDPIFDDDFPGARVEVHTRDGRVLTRTVTGAEYRKLLPQAGDLTALEAKLDLAVTTPGIGPRQVLEVGMALGPSTSVADFLEVCAPKAG